MSKPQSWYVEKEIRALEADRAEVIGRVRAKLYLEGASPEESAHIKAEIHKIFDDSRREILDRLEKYGLNEPWQWPCAFGFAPLLDPLPKKEGEG